MDEEKNPPKKIPKEPTPPPSEIIKEGDEKKPK